jgi:hypothetical protein
MKGDDEQIMIPGWFYRCGECKGFVFGYTQSAAAVVLNAHKERDCQEIRNRDAKLKRLAQYRQAQHTLPLGN